MEDFLLDNERAIYTIGFFLAITLVATWEGLAPRRNATQLLRLRWAGNFGIGFFDIVLVYLVFPVAAVGFAMLIEAHGLGLLHLVNAPFWIAAIIGFLAIDLGRYTQHYFLHRIPLLWRVHRIHHADQDYDFTVGLRFHPIDGLFTTGFGFCVILLVGPPPIMVAIAEILLAVAAFVVHANGRTPQWVESYVRLIFVTPDMHRIHHSVQPEEHNSNYAALFSFWDRLFSTYVSAPAVEHEHMLIGLADLRGPRYQGFRWMFMAPFLATESTSAQPVKFETAPNDGTR